MKAMDLVLALSIILVLAGALNWGAIVLGYDLVEMVSMGHHEAELIIKASVGVAAVVLVAYKILKKPTSVKLSM